MSKKIPDLQVLTPDYMGWRITFTEDFRFRGYPPEGVTARTIGPIGSYHAVLYRINQWKSHLEWQRRRAAGD